VDFSQVQESLMKEGIGAFRCPLLEWKKATFEVISAPPLPLPTLAYNLNHFFL
jgi:hypothetical protein